MQLIFIFHSYSYEFIFPIQFIEKKNKLETPSTTSINPRCHSEHVAFLCFCRKAESSPSNYFKLPWVSYWSLLDCWVLLWTLLFPAHGKHRWEAAGHQQPVNSCGCMAACSKAWQCLQSLVDTHTPNGQYQVSMCHWDRLKRGLEEAEEVSEITSTSIYQN